MGHQHNLTRSSEFSLSRLSKDIHLPTSSIMDPSSLPRVHPFELPAKRPNLPFVLEQGSPRLQPTDGTSPPNVTVLTHPYELKRDASDKVPKCISKSKDDYSDFGKISSSLQSSDMSGCARTWSTPLMNLFPPKLGSPQPYQNYPLISVPPHPAYHSESGLMDVFKNNHDGPNITTAAAYSQQFSFLSNYISQNPQFISNFLSFMLQHNNPLSTRNEVKQEPPTTLSTALRMSRSPSTDCLNASYNTTSSAMDPPSKDNGADRFSISALTDSSPVLNTDRRASIDSMEKPDTSNDVDSINSGRQLTDKDLDS